VNTLDYRRKASHFNREVSGKGVCHEDRTSTGHTLHQSYFHAFTASILLPMFDSLVELQPYA
jgi:hypothetical protein